MDTPICDFVREYSRSNALRLHMPGHKGSPVLGMEQLDITEIDGADSLYEASGVIAKSEENASRLFGCPTFYSTEGSSQCIRAMLYLTLLYARMKGNKSIVAAVRNVHRTFLTAVAMLDMEVQWLYPKNQTSYLSCELSAKELDSYLGSAAEKPAAVYLTSPDYLGTISDISALAEICHRHDVLLLVDNAHGAYLKFLKESMHPIDLGADMCCDSAHKTLPVLTGGAYLHISGKLENLCRQAKNALAMFGSTSPSYLILQSLDAANTYLAKCRQIFTDYIPMVDSLKKRLSAHGFELHANEPMKLTVAAKSYGCTGIQLAEILRDNNIEPEFSDRDYLVLMLTPEIGETQLERLEQVLTKIAPETPIKQDSPTFLRGEKVISVREAMLSQSEILPLNQCLGRILAVPTVSCPPAVPILICGERIDQHALSCFAYYGIDECCVVKEG
ncbi:MAG: aminotransferase class V-fold PLP-dependent enzyme [Clostridia bacterium]|nr:aminotransferase class V-fold PLP-dependent enzyme [Clostridia bacterium]